MVLSFYLRFLYVSGYGYQLTKTKVNGIWDFVLNSNSRYALTGYQFSKRNCYDEKGGTNTYDVNAAQNKSRN